MGQSKLSTNK